MQAADAQIEATVANAALQVAKEKLQKEELAAAQAKFHCELAAAQAKVDHELAATQIQASLELLQRKRKAVEKAA